MFDPLTITEFRQQSGTVFSDVIQGHRPRVIRRGQRDMGLLVGFEELSALLADRSFAPQVMRGEGSVSVWLPEFEIYGEGATYAEAKGDLLDEVRVYVQEYIANVDAYRRAPNRAGHFAHVLRARIADLRGELAELIFPGPPDLATLQAQMTGRGDAPGPVPA